LTDELEQSLTDLTTTSGQSISLIVQDALAHYVDWRAEQLLDLQEAIAAADRGKFATEEDKPEALGIHQC
jgi:predicted transcriptional regulator